MLKIKAGFKFLIVLVILSIALFSFLPEEQMQRFSDMGKDKTSLSRFAYWDYGMEVILDNPILGIGYDNWLSYSWFYMPGGIYRGNTELPHNIFIEAGAELGFSGLICFILLIIFAFIINARTRKITVKNENRLLYFLTYGLDLGLVGYLVAGFFVTVLYYPFFWVQIAMTVALHNVSLHAVPENQAYAEQKAGRFLNKKVAGR